MPPAICRSIIGARDGQLWASANVPRGAIGQFTTGAQGQRCLTQAPALAA